jgi:hypothetical protein
VFNAQVTGAKPLQVQSSTCWLGSAVEPSWFKVTYARLAGKRASSTKVVLDDASVMSSRYTRPIAKAYLGEVGQGRHLREEFRSYLAPRPVSRTPIQVTSITE